MIQAKLWDVGGMDLGLDFVLTLLSSIRDAAKTIAETGFKMFLGISAKVSQIDEKECKLVSYSYSRTARQSQKKKQNVRGIRRLKLL